MKYIVERWDDNEKSPTYKSWVFVTRFNYESAAREYVIKASTPTFLLAYRIEE